MSNLAQLSTQLNQKDSEKSTVLAEMKKLNEERFQGFSGRMQFSVYHVDKLDGKTLEFDYEVTPDDDHLCFDSLSCRTLADHISMLVRNKELTIKIKCKAFSTSTYIDNADANAEESDEVAEVLTKTEACYIASLSATEIPSDTELRTELFAVFEALPDVEINEETAEIKPVFHVKASYDDFNALLASKTLELAQLESDMNKISQAMQETKKSTASSSSGSSSKKASTRGGKKKAGGAGGNKRQSRPVRTMDDIEEEAPAASSGVMGQVWGYVGMGLAAANEKRNYLLWGAAATVLFLYGDYASV